MTEQLAVLGGTPVRTRPYLGSGDFDQEEILNVMEVFRRGEFSRYAGGGAPDLAQVLALKSRDTDRYPLPYWNYLGGEMVRRFEADWCGRFGCDYAMAVNSATTGLSLALAAIGIEPGDEVITTPLSFTATATSILLFNAVPVFADVDPVTCCLDPASVAAAITPRTRAILVVHLLGNAADMDALAALARQHNLKLIEDCAQAPGVRYRGREVGTIGDAGVYSFQETKNLMTGEGGMVVTDDPAIARAVRLIRNHGEFALAEETPAAELVNIVGGNFRMTELTAALGVAQLRRLNQKNAWRNRNAAQIRRALADVPFLSFRDQPDWCEPICHILSMEYDAAQTGVPKPVFVTALQREGIPVSGGYPRLLYNNALFRRQIAYGGKGCPFTCPLNGEPPRRQYGPGLTPVAERLIAERHVWFYHVNYPNTEADMADVVRAVRKVAANIEALRTADPAQLTPAYGR